MTWTALGTLSVVTDNVIMDEIHADEGPNHEVIIYATTALA